MTTVQSLYIYPVKSLSGISVDSLSFDNLGPINDRRYMLVNKDGSMMTQREHPFLAKFKTDISDHTLLISYEGDQISINLEQTSNNIVASEVWGDNVKGNEVNTEISKWFSSKLNKDVIFIKFNLNTPRTMDRNYVNFDAKVGFADGFQILLTQQSSLEALDLDKNEDILRFRPNIVVTGDKAFSEDYWRIISINKCDFAIVKPCERCLMPSVNPTDGSTQPKVIRALAQKRLFNKGVYFGQNLALINQTHSTIKVNDSVFIKEKSTQSNIA